MKHIMKGYLSIISIIIIALFSQSCEKDTGLELETTAAFTGSYKVATDCLIPTSNKNLKAGVHTSLQYLTIIPKGEHKVWIEQLGVMATIKGEQLDIPYQHNKVEQRTLTGYGHIEGETLKLYYSTTDDVWGITYTCSIQGVPWTLYQ